MTSRSLAALWITFLGVSGCATADEQAEPSFSQPTAADHLRAAEQLKAEGRISLALGEVEQAIRLCPGWHKPYEDRAFLNMALFRNEAAVCDLSAALSCGVDEPCVVLHWRGTLRSTLGDFDGAIADLSSAIAMKPKFVEALSDRAQAWLGRGDFELAISDATAALQLDSEHVLSLIRRARALSSVGRDVLAGADLDCAVRIAPANPLPLSERAEWNLRIGNFAAAVSDCKAALDCATPGSQRAERVRQCLEEAARKLGQTGGN